MFGVGPEELFLIAVIALLVLGPERMPKVMRDVGRIVGDLRKTSDELREEFMNADRALKEPFTGPTSSSTTPSTTPTPAVESTQAGASDGAPAESAFDREMREARERLRGA
jgi:sec-independent protein translocase protein TatB